MTSSYPVSGALRVRLGGALILATGLLIALAALAVWLLPLPGWLLGAAVLTGAVAVVAGGWWVLRAAPVLQLDDEGYQVRYLRGAGVRRARWREVEDLVTTVVAGDRCVVLRLRDGRATTIPVSVVAGSPQALVADLSQHLDKGYGYRRLR